MMNPMDNRNYIGSYTNDQPHCPYYDETKWKKIFPKVN